jgi:protein SCO1
VLVGLDARETPDEARRKHASLLAQLGRGDEPWRWPYLTGARASIDAVAGALGFRYAWDPRTEQYAHPAVIFALTPNGRVARYLHGVQFDPAEVAAALDTAAAGRAAPAASAAAVDVLRCFRFDPASRRAGARAQTFLRIGAACVFALLVGAIAVLVRWERRRASASGPERRASGPEGGTP